MGGIILPNGDLQNGASLTIVGNAEPKVHPPGTIGVPSGDLARFPDFTFSLTILQRPPGCTWSMPKGVSVARNRNHIWNEFKGTDGEWLWMLDDDHCFTPDALVKLLDRNVDVVAPLVFKKRPPFSLVAFKEFTEANGYVPFAPSEIPEKGLFEVFACGGPGVLIRRHVLEALEEPIYETTGDLQNEDLELCRKIREAGFKIYVDSEVWFGHFGIVNVMPARIAGKMVMMVEFDENHRIFIDESSAVENKVVPV